MELILLLIDAVTSYIDSCSFGKRNLQGELRGGGREGGYRFCALNLAVKHKPLIETVLCVRRCCSYLDNGKFRRLVPIALLELFMSTKAISSSIEHIQEDDCPDMVISFI
jgi:hypothetical protein